MLVEQKDSWLSSRQLVYNRTSVDSPESLDDGDRRRATSQAAYDLASRSDSQTALARFEAIRMPLVRIANAQPFSRAGPWWMWNYIQFNDRGASDFEVAFHFVL